MSSFNELFASLIGFTRSLVHEKQPKKSKTHIAAMTITAISQPCCWAAMSVLCPLKAFAMGMNSSRAMKLPM